MVEQPSHRSPFSLGLDQSWSEGDVAAFHKATAFLEAAIAAYSSRIEIASEHEKPQLIAARAATIRQKQLLSVGDETTRQIAVMADNATIDDIRRSQIK